MPYLPANFSIPRKNNPQQPDLMQRAMWQVGGVPSIKTTAVTNLYIHQIMLTYINKSRAFTLVEIMIVVAIIALLATLALPSLLRARKRSQASTVIEELRLIDAAVDQYAIEYNKAKGNDVPWDAVKMYLKEGSVLYNSGGKDKLGNAFAAQKVDILPVVPDATFTALSDVAPREFWSPFIAP